eukprot:6212919-Pleurochrysis_carterae.AAC.5
MQNNRELSHRARNVLAGARQGIMGDLRRFAASCSTERSVPLRAKRCARSSTSVPRCSSCGSASVCEDEDASATHRWRSAHPVEEREDKGERQWRGIVDAARPAARGNKAVEHLRRHSLAVLEQDDQRRREGRGRLRSRGRPTLRCTRSPGGGLPGLQIGVPPSQYGQIVAAISHRVLAGAHQLRDQELDREGEVDTFASTQYGDVLGAAAPKLSEQLVHLHAVVCGRAVCVYNCNRKLGVCRRCGNLRVNRAVFLASDKGTSHCLFWHVPSLLKGMHMNQVH